MKGGSVDRSALACREPWVPSPVPHTLGLVVHAWYHLRDGKQEDHAEFEMNLGYKRPCLQNKTSFSTHLKLQIGQPCNIFI